MSKKVSVYSGTGSVKQIEFNGTKWSELRSVLSNNGISYNSGAMKAIVGETENTLESDDAVVPTTDFTLFLLPQKVKSGYDEDSYEESYDEEEEEGEDNQVVAPATTLPINGKDWSKGEALSVIDGNIRKLEATTSELYRLRDYVSNVAVSPLDEKAKELMNKLFK